VHVVCAIRSVCVRSLVSNALTALCGSVVDALALGPTPDCAHEWWQRGAASACHHGPVADARRRLVGVERLRRRVEHVALDAGHATTTVRARVVLLSHIIAHVNSVLTPIKPAAVVDAPRDGASSSSSSRSTGTTPLGSVVRQVTPYTAPAARPRRRSSETALLAVCTRDRVR
jgi:hypothetical protein